MLPLGRGARVQPLHPIRSAFLALCCVASFTFLSAGLTAPAQGLVFDFQGYDHGEILDGMLNLGPEGPIESVTTINQGIGPDIAIIFDSAERNTADDDLEGPNLSGGGSWAGGNLAPDTYLGNLLIISENDKDRNHDGRIDRPDDEGSKPAGSIHIVFTRAFTDFGFDLVDIEDDNETMGSIEFLFDGQSVGDIAFEDLHNLQPDIRFGNNTANRIGVFNTMDALQIDAFEEVVVRFGGSGGITNLSLTITPVPEPGTALLIGLGIAGMAVARSRRASLRLGAAS